MTPASPPGDPRTAKAQRVWDRHAPKYDRDMRRVERLLFAGGREWVCSRARGQVLEIAIGTGRNLPFYPSDAVVTGIDLSPAMLALARARAADLGIRAELRVADAQALPFPDESFDTVVCTLSLCTIPDLDAAVGQMHRVLRPGGQLLLLDHVGSTNAGLRAVQHLIELATIRLFGEHQTRQPLNLLRTSGFEIAELERGKAGTVQRVRAVRPVGD